MTSRRQQQQEVLWSVRLPRDLAARIEKRADQEGVGRSQVIREMLDAGLRRKPSSRDKLQQIHDEVKALRRQVGDARKTKKGDR